MKKLLSVIGVLLLVPLLHIGFADSVEARVKCEKPFSSAWACREAKNLARVYARVGWKNGVESRWGAGFSSWGNAKRKKVQCRRTPLRMGGQPSPCATGTGKWQCRASACARSRF